MRAILLQIVCLGLVLHGLDANIDSWTGPLTATNVQPGVTPGSATADATIYVAESTQLGMLVTTVTATGDAAGTISYTLSETTNTFKIDAADGAIYLFCSSLNYASKSTYTLTVTASESGATDTGTLTLTVNVNTPPVVTGGEICSCNIETGTASATTLKTYAATDLNTGDTRTYALTATDWAISAAGVLTTNAILDNAIKQCYQLTITVTDNGGVAAGTTATTAVQSSVTISVGATGTTLACTCYSGAATIAGSIMLLLAACIARFM